MHHPVRLFSPSSKIANNSSAPLLPNFFTTKTPIRSEKSRHFPRGRRDLLFELLGASVSMGLAGSDSEVVGRAVAAALATSSAVFVIAIELAFGGRSSSPRHLSRTLFRGP